MFDAKPVRRVYGKPWTEIIKDAQANPEFLNEVGKILVKFIIKEARKDLARQGNKATARGKPEGIPASEKFFESWSFHLVGRSTIEILSTWPWVEQIVEGRSPYKMTWMRQSGMPPANAGGVAPLFSKTRSRPASGPARRPPGKVMYRTTPGKFQRNWIHPGFAKHNFIERAARKAKTDIDEALRTRLGKALSKSANWK